MAGSSGCAGQEGKRETETPLHPPRSPPRHQRGQEARDERGGGDIIHFLEGHKGVSWPSAFLPPSQAEETFRNSAFI